MRVLDKLLALADRTLVLFIGIAVGMVVGLAFLGQSSGEAVASAPPPPEAVAAAAEPPALEAAAAECAMPFNPRLTEALSGGEPVHIGVFGDSFGDGLWAGLYHAFRGDDDFVVHQFAQQSTGFTRYQSLDLFDDIGAKIAAQPVDIAVLSFGANDTQGIWTGNSAAAYMSPEWQRVVGERVEAIVQMLRDQGAIVYWVGLPRMRRPEFDAQIRQMNAFYRGKMRELGVPFIDTASLSVDEQGNYTAYLPDPETGERTLARANDGIHMTMTGYGFLTGGLVERIRDYVGAARTEAERQAERRHTGSDAAGEERAG